MEYFLRENLGTKENKDTVYWINMKKRSVRIVWKMLKNWLGTSDFNALIILMLMMMGTTTKLSVG